MSIRKKIKQEGVSLRTVNFWMVFVVFLISGLLVFETFRSAASFRKLSAATDDYVQLQKAASELMEASDYLTEEVQCFTVTGEREHLERYFDEAFVSMRREAAIEKLSVPGEEDAREQLQLAMNESVDLMEREFYAMRLILEAAGSADIPGELQSIELSAEDLALNAPGMIHRAQLLVHDSAYYGQKNRIREKMESCLEELEKAVHSAQESSFATLRRDLMTVRVMIMILVAGILLMLLLTTRLGINPVLRAVKNIRDDSPIPIIGAEEFRYLASTYNKMYDAYKKSFEKLNYKASHDELTGLYNRAGYELLISGLELKSTVMLLIDADCFKNVNDSFGHETGDRMLQKVAAVIRRNFRADDYICRIGGDEFVVLMVHTEEQREELIRAKIRRINRELGEENGDGLPPISVSAGVAHGRDADDLGALFEHADLALYRVKESGRRGYSVYRP